jgi:hypothetical protein
MVILEAIRVPQRKAIKPPVHYRLQARHPATGQAFDSRYSRMETALAQGSVLLQEGYCFEIWSPAFLEKRAAPVDRVRAAG